MAVQVWKGDVNFQGTMADKMDNDSGFDCVVIVCTPSYLILSYLIECKVSAFCRTSLYI